MAPATGSSRAPLTPCAYDPPTARRSSKGWKRSPQGGCAPRRPGRPRLRRAQPRPPPTSSPARRHTAPRRALSERQSSPAPEGYYTQGWVRSDAKGTGQLTRLFARVIVLERGGRKLALVSEDLNGVAGGTLLDAANRDADIGFSEQNVLDSASHTHAAEGGYFNFSTYNTVAPAPNSPTQLSVAFDPRLYGFLVERLALAIRRDNANLGPAQLGWGHTELLGVTENRSLEAPPGELRHPGVAGHGQRRAGSRGLPGHRRPQRRCAAGGQALCRPARGQAPGPVPHGLRPAPGAADQGPPLRTSTAPAPRGPLGQRRPPRRGHPPDRGRPAGRRPGARRPGHRRCLRQR